MTVFPQPGERIWTTAVKWQLDHEVEWVQAIDDFGNLYQHFLDNHVSWDSAWKEYRGVQALRIYGRVGEKDTPRGRRFFAEQVKATDITVPQPELPFDASNDVPRSPWDVVNDLAEKGRQKSHRPKAKATQVKLDEDMTNQCRIAAKELKIPVAQVVSDCLREGRTPQALLTSRGR